MNETLTLTLLAFLLSACSTSPRVRSGPVLPQKSHLVEIHFNQTETAHPSSTLRAYGDTSGVLKQGFNEVAGPAFA